MKKLVILIIVFFTSNSLQALELKGEFYQGNLILGKTDSKSKVFVDKKMIKVSDKGFFVFGLGKNRKNDVTIEIIKTRSKKKNYKKNLQKKI